MSRGQAHLNLNSITAGDFSPILNWIKLAPLILTRTVGGNISGKAMWDAGIYLDGNGDLVNPVPADVLTAIYTFYAKPLYQGSYNLGGMQWAVTWDGSATCFVNLLTSGSSQSMGANSGTFTFGTNPSNTQLIFTITNVNDPPRNIKVYQTRYAANVAAGEKFNPDWIAQIRNFDTLRFVNWNGINNTNGLGISEISQFADENYYLWGGSLTVTSGNGSNGPKGAAPLSLMTALANQTGCKIHICIPYLASDACVTAMATFFRDGTNVEVVYEFINEGWNAVYGPQTTYLNTQGNAIWPGDSSRHLKWYGYRAAQIMKIIMDVYNDSSRWRGALASQTANSAVTDSALIGVAYWKSSTGSSLNVSDLFKSLYITSYFGAVQVANNIAAITRANPAVVTCSQALPFANGATVKIFIYSTGGMIELDNMKCTVQNINTGAKTFELAGLDSSSFTAFVTNGGYCINSLIWDVMDQSNTNHVSDPVMYPTKYTYFNQQMAQCMKHGTGTLAGVSGSSGVIDNLVSTYWPAHKTSADANGLDLRQYEGLCMHYVGNSFLGNSGNASQFNEYMYALGHSEECADVIDYCANAFTLAGGAQASRFNDCGNESTFGTWPAIRYLPGDEGNPVWLAVKRYNERKRRWKF